ncbi:GIY-YIG nuclease family protein [Melioribacter sp. OK-6-Me]|uniref:GIY-YIG nuclease family protein n=1 Tax=unclassified Melioribacter TaxID=2627329 RepID=UPI003EDB2BAC
MAAIAFRRGSATGGKTNGLLNMFYVYILRSEVTEKYYIGHTANYEKRLKDHNRGKVRSTKPFVPWKIVYLEEYNSKSEAFKREMQIKSYKSGEAFRRLINK